ncbi:MAG: hypothetical protein IJT88_10270 [Kiritimatiellae bacterium]|nr:hypothetical protein [Kiritimatiellia bacterium]
MESGFQANQVCPSFARATARPIDEEEAEKGIPNLSGLVPAGWRFLGLDGFAWLPHSWGEGWEVPGQRVYFPLSPMATSPLPEGDKNLNADKCEKMKVHHSSAPKVRQNLLLLAMLFVIGSICLVACKSPPLDLIERVKVSHRQAIPTMDGIRGEWVGIDLRFANQAFLFFDNDGRGYWKYDWFESTPIMENFEWSIDGKEIRLTQDGGSGMLWNCAWLEIWQALGREKIIMTGFYPDGSLKYVFNRVRNDVPLQKGADKEKRQGRAGDSPVDGDNVGTR